MALKTSADFNVNWGVLFHEMTDRKNKSNDYMRYSGMAFELVGLLVVAVLLGGKLDAWMGNEVRYITLALLFLFLIGYFIRIYYSLTK